MNRPGIALLFFFFLSLAPGLGAAPIPDFRGAITDDASMIDDAAEGRILARIRQLREQKGSQIFVVTISTLEGETIEDFSQRLFETWRPGRAEIDDGVLFVIAREDRKARIHTGYGLEGAIPDALARQILANTVAPLFREEKYSEGVEAGVDRLIAAIQGEALPSPDREDEQEKPASRVSIVWILIGLLNLPGILVGLISKDEEKQLAGKWLLGLAAALWLPSIPVMMMGWDLPHFWKTLYVVVSLLLLGASGLFLFGAPGRAHSLAGASPVQAR